MTITELLSLPDALRLAERQVAALERIATALEMMYPDLALDYAGSSPEDGTIDFADSDATLTADEVEETERVQSKRDRDERIAIAPGSDSF